MKKKLLVMLMAVSASAFAFERKDCNALIFGSWHVTHTSTELDKDKLKEEMPNTFSFKPDGTVSISLGGFMNFSHPFHCDDQSIVLDKMVPSVLNLSRVSGNELVWKEKGDDKYFYLAK